MCRQCELEAGNARRHARSQHNVARLKLAEACRDGQQPAVLVGHGGHVQARSEARLAVGKPRDGAQWVDACLPVTLPLVVEQAHATGPGRF